MTSSTCYTPQCCDVLWPGCCWIRAHVICGREGADIRTKGGERKKGVCQGSLAILSRARGSFYLLRLGCARRKNEREREWARVRVMARGKPGQVLHRVLPLCHEFQVGTTLLNRSPSLLLISFIINNNIYISISSFSSYQNIFFSFFFSRI